jgi:two-component system, chemotaxis family, sensor kinase CheA
MVALAVCFPRKIWERQNVSGNAADRFRQMFFEEASELLDMFNDGLTLLNQRPPDRTVCDKTFRAIHSLKGAANMVGLAVLAEFAHAIEAVVGRVRDGSLEVDSRVNTTLAAARAYLQAMVEAEAAGSPIPASEELTESLRVLADWKSERN